MHHIYNNANNVWHQRKCGHRQIAGINHICFHRNVIITIFLRLRIEKKNSSYNIRPPTNRSYGTNIVRCVTYFLSYGTYLICMITFSQGITTARAYHRQLSVEQRQLAWTVMNLGLSLTRTACGLDSLSGGRLHTSGIHGCQSFDVIRGSEIKGWRRSWWQFAQYSAA